MSQKAAATPDPEEIAGRYQVVKRLGAGAFGTVFKVKDKVLGRMLAIKTIRMEGLAAAGISIEELMDRFRREAQISAQLKHPNIVTIYDVGEADGMSYLAMEFIDGVGLDRVIATAGRLPLERAALIGAQVADALDFAHRHNVVHRDVKPANIMIEAGDRVKVTDFGIAKVTDSGDHLTMTGSLLGTPSYMSPEQARGGKLDGRSDLFAVGAILYEMLTGQKAFRGDSITGLIFKIITEEPQALSEIEPTIPPEIVRIIQKALSKAPETRYQSGRELAEDLLAHTRAGGAPTLRQAEVDTMRGPATSPDAPTMGGRTPTVTQPPASAPPRPADPTYLVASGTPPPPAVDPTYLVSGARAPRPAPPPPPPAPRAAAGPAAAPVPRAPSAPRAPAPAAKSRTGLVVGLAAAAVVALLLIGGGVVLFVMKDDTTQTAATGGATSVAPIGGESAGGGTGAAVPPASGGTPADAGAAAATVTDAAAGSGPEARTADTATQPAGAASRTSTPVADAGRTPATGGTASARSGTGGGAAAAAGAGVPDLSILDREPPELTGRETGAEVADTYRSSRGSSSGFGASGRLRARSKVPVDLTLAEKRAAVVLVNLMGLQAVHKRRAGQYGSFREIMPVPVDATNVMSRAGYKFELKMEEEGYSILATSTSGRALIADDSGFVRYVED